MIETFLTGASAFASDAAETMVLFAGIAWEWMSAQPAWRWVAAQPVWLTLTVATATKLAVMTPVVVRRLRRRAASRPAPVTPAPLFATPVPVLPAPSAVRFQPALSMARQGASVTEIARSTGLSRDALDLLLASATSRTRQGKPAPAGVAAPTARPARRIFGRLAT